MAGRRHARINLPHNAAKGGARGRPRGSRRGQGIGRGRSVGDQSTSDNLDHIGVPEATTPVGWAPPHIQPRSRSPHRLQCQQPAATPPSGGSPHAPASQFHNGDDARVNGIRFSPHSALGHHRQRRCTTDDGTIGPGGGQLSDAVRGLAEAFDVATRIQDWLHRNTKQGESDIWAFAEELLPRLEGPFGYSTGRPLPDAVWVPLPVLGYDPADYGGVQHFVGEPRERWQEGGVAFYFIEFQGCVGGKKVRVSNCLALHAVEEAAGPTNGGGPSNGLEEESDNSRIPEFPTQRLDEEVVSPLHRPCVHQENTAEEGPLLAPRKEVPPNSSGSSSSELNWQPDWRDCEGDASSLDYSASEVESDVGSVDLLHEIGDYERDGDLDDLEFRGRYHDRFW